MLWGSFGLVHLFSLIVGVFLNVCLYFMIKKMPIGWQRLILFTISLLGIAAILFNLFRWNSPLEYLPFHLCSLTALILPFAVITQNKALNNLLLLWSLGALFALIINTAQADFEIFSWTFFFYYIPHVFECGIPIVMLKLNLFKKDFRCVTSTLIITLITYTAVHFINMALNNYFVKYHITNWQNQIIQVNYMYSIKPENPLLQLFYNLIPYSYWYLFLALPVILLYLFLLYLPEFKDMKKNRYAK